MTNPIFYPSGYVTIAATSTVATVDNTTKASGWINMALYDHVMFIVNTTDATGDTTVNVKLRSADDGSGTNAADITNLAVTQFTAAATSKAVVLEVRPTQLNTGDTHVEALCTMGNGTNGAVTSIIALGFNAKSLPPSNNATVIEVKNLG